ncbi:methionine-synthesizing 5- methyltetrahydropteroyltriglutamate--homocysteine methyltransferase [Sorochytrium milnesiophthora]
MVLATNLGFPRIGANRELKRLVENYWAGKVDQKALVQGAKGLREDVWRLQQRLGLDHVPCNDFSYYDQVLDAAVTFDVVPDAYRAIDDPLTRYFAMARGRQVPASEGQPAVDVPAMEMKKWFDTNYHHIVPRFEPSTSFKLANLKPLEEFLEAKQMGVHARPVIIGPVSFLLLGRSKTAGFDQLSLLDKLLPVYVDLLRQLAQAGADWIQIDEPCLVFSLPASALSAYEKAYARLAADLSSSVKLLLTTYFDSIEHNLATVARLPVAGVHLDLSRQVADAAATDATHKLISALPKTTVLSLGLVSGRNIWKTNLHKALEVARAAVTAAGGDTDRILVGPSCSLLHSPVSLDSETKLDAEIKDWLAFATEKIGEIVTLKRALNEGDAAVAQQLESNKQSIDKRKHSSRIHNQAVKQRLQHLSPSDFTRHSPFVARWAVQQQRLSLPLFPTTTVGSFPQTKEVRQVRAQLKKGDITEQQYWDFINAETEKCVRFQEEVGLDVLVHGEFERNDMVEFFGENLDGYVFTANGWVQSYGSRCVKPPVIFGDISRPRAMTVEMSRRAQAMTTKPMKGMLTGPITMLQWSFVRDDQPRRDTAFQLALAIRDEVQDLERAGIQVVQVDEPAIREGLPLRRADWDAYLTWAVDAFLLATTGVADSTQVHSHMCYSDFNDIFSAIVRMDADVLSIENSKSDLKLLAIFDTQAYTNGIGPGVFDIHSPRVPSQLELQTRVQQMLERGGLKRDLLWVNPDCGLKTRGWKEVGEALTNMCTVAKELRKSALPQSSTTSKA